MNRKVVRLVNLVDQGFAVESVDVDLDGGVCLHLGRGPARDELRFAFYEVPAIHAATKVVGVAG